MDINFLEFKTMTATIAIVGGRDFSDYGLLKTKLDEIRRVYPTIDCVVSGGARGADQLGEQYAREQAPSMPGYEKLKQQCDSIQTKIDALEKSLSESHNRKSDNDQPIRLNSSVSRNSSDGNPVLFNPAFIPYDTAPRHYAECLNLYKGFMSMSLSSNKPDAFIPHLVSLYRDLKTIHTVLPLRETIPLPVQIAHTEKGDLASAIRPFCYNDMDPDY
jgi:hypothetical protein